MMVLTSQAVLNIDQVLELGDLHLKQLTDHNLVIPVCPSETKVKKRLSVKHVEVSLLCIITLNRQCTITGQDEKGISKKVKLKTVLVLSIFP